MDTRVTTFHGRVYGNKVLRKTSDLPDDLTNASAATRRVFEPAAQQSKRPAKDKRSVFHPARHAADERAALDHRL